MFNSLDFKNMMPSAWSSFPTESEPDNRYKFSSILLSFGPDLQVIERQTYSMLELLGDVGGLFDALRILGVAIVLPFSSFLMKQALLYNLFSSINLHAKGPEKAVTSQRLYRCKVQSYLKKLRNAYETTMRELDLVK